VPWRSCRGLPRWVVRMRDVLHFSFTVSDIEQSIDWYTKMLGLELVARQRSDSDYIRTLVGVPDAVLEVAQFKIPGVSPGISSHMLELVEYVIPRSANSRIPITRVGAAHLAFIVLDIDSVYERLERHGVEFVNPPVRITQGVNSGGAACYFLDPDGITLELLSLPSSSLSKSEREREVA